MSVIDTRLVQIDSMRKQHEEVATQNPKLAAEIIRRKNLLVDEMQQELIPLFARCKTWTSSS